MSVSIMCSLRVLEFSTGTDPASFLFPEAQLVICYTTRVASTHSNAMSFLSLLTTFNCIILNIASFCIIFILHAVKPRTLSP